MSQPLITSLTAKQKALIRLYRDKRKDLALSSEPMDREQAKSAIKAAYSVISTTDSFAENFCWNPDVESDLFGLTVDLWNDLRIDLRHQVQAQLDDSLLIHLTAQIRGGRQFLILHQQFLTIRCI